MSDVFSGFDSVYPRNQNEITSKTFSSDASEVNTSPNADVFSGFDALYPRDPNEVTIKNFAVEKATEEEAKDDEKRDRSHLGIPKGTFGKYSNRRQGGVLRYPLEMMTQETDYLQIDIQKYIPLQSYRSVPGDNSRYVTGNNFTNRAGRRLSQNLSTKPLINDGTILLPIPSDLKDVNAVKYDTGTINGLEAIGALGAE